MKLIIDIPEERYKDIQRIASVQADRNHFQTAEQIIANGTPILDNEEYIQVKNKEPIDKLTAPCD